MSYLIEITFESEKAMKAVEARDAIRRAFGWHSPTSTTRVGGSVGAVDEVPTDTTGSKARFLAKITRDLDADYEVAARMRPGLGVLEDALRAQFSDELNEKRDGLSANDRLDDDGLCVASMTVIAAGSEAYAAFVAAGKRWSERPIRNHVAEDSYRQDLLGHARVLARRGVRAERSWPSEVVDAYSEVVRGVVKTHLEDAMKIDAAEDAEELTRRLEHVADYLRRVSGRDTKKALTASS